MASAASNVESLLGVPPKFAGSAMGVANMVESGLSVAAVDRLAKALAPDDPNLKYRLVPKPTLARRRKYRQPLSAEEGNRMARVAKLFEMATAIFGDERKARDFLGRPHVMLDDAAPLDVALATGPGADAEIHLLGRAANGGGA